MPGQSGGRTLGLRLCQAIPERALDDREGDWNNDIASSIYSLPDPDHKTRASVVGLSSLALGFLEDLCQVFAITLPRVLASRFGSLSTKPGSKFGVLKELPNHPSQCFCVCRIFQNHSVKIVE